MVFSAICSRTPYPTMYLATIVTLATALAVDAETPPTDDPVATRYPQGPAGRARAAINGIATSQFPWDNVVAAAQKTSSDHNAGSLESDPASAYATAAAQVLKQNPLGGVVYFPAGTYTFKGDLPLIDRVMVRLDRRLLHRRPAPCHCLWSWAMCWYVPSRRGNNHVSLQEGE